MESRCGAYTRRMIGGFSLEQLHDRLQKKVQEVRTGVHSGQPLWHPKYCPHDGDSISDIVFRAYDFLVEKVHTLDEVPGVPGGGITLIPYLAQVYIATDRWVRALLGGYPLFIEKSRRMVVSWTLAALELWLGGWRRSHIYVAAQHDAAGRHRPGHHAGHGRRQDRAAARRIARGTGERVVRRGGQALQHACGMFEPRVAMVAVVLGRGTGRLGQRYGAQVAKHGEDRAQAAHHVQGVGHAVGSHRIRRNVRRPAA